MSAFASLFHVTERCPLTYFLMQWYVRAPCTFICSLKELMGRAWVRYRDFYLRERMLFKNMWFHFDSGHYRDDEP